MQFYMILYWLMTEVYGWLLGLIVIINLSSSYELQSHQFLGGVMVRATVGSSHNSDCIPLLQLDSYNSERQTWEELYLTPQPSISQQTHSCFQVCMSGNEGQQGLACPPHIQLLLHELSNPTSALHHTLQCSGTVNLLKLINLNTTIFGFNELDKW